MGNFTPGKNLKCYFDSFFVSLYALVAFPLFGNNYQLTQLVDQ